MPKMTFQWVFTYFVITTKICSLHFHNYLRLLILQICYNGLKVNPWVTKCFCPLLTFGAFCQCPGRGRLAQTVALWAARPSGPVSERREGGPEAAYVHRRHFVLWHCGLPDPAARQVKEEKMGRRQHTCTVDNLQSSGRVSKKASACIIFKMILDSPGKDRQREEKFTRVKSPCGASWNDGQSPAASKTTLKFQP